MAVQVWSGVAVAVQSALATAVTISGISKASPAVVSHSGTDPSNGDFVVLNVEGMHEVDQRVFRVASVSAGVSFELEGEDSSNYSTFTSGTFEVITFGTSLGTVAGVSQSGGDKDSIDITTVHDNVRKTIPGVASEVIYTLEHNWEPGDTGLAALKAASQVSAQRAFKFTFSSGAILGMYGYVGYTGAVGGTNQDKASTQGTVNCSGIPTEYAS